MNEPLNQKSRRLADEIRSLKDEIRALKARVAAAIERSTTTRKKVDAETAQASAVRRASGFYDRGGKP